MQHAATIGLCRTSDSSELFADRGEDGAKHFGCQKAGVGVVARAVETIIERDAATQIMTPSMGEREIGFSLLQSRQGLVVRDAPQS